MSYLSVAEYIRRFGERETTRITCEAVASATPPTFDSAKVQVALDDTTEIIDSYVGIKYVTPIAEPPNIVKGWNAALAREQLHGNAGGAIPDGITKAADLARSQLKDVSKGLLSLPVALGDTAPATAGGSASSSKDRPCPVFTETAAQAFTAPFTGGTQGSAWRQGH